MSLLGITIVNFEYFEAILIVFTLVILTAVLLVIFIVFLYINIQYECFSIKRYVGMSV